MKVSNLYNRNHDAWLSMRLSYSKFGRSIGRDFVSGGLRDMVATTQPGFLLEVKTNSLDKRAVIQKLREAVRGVAGKLPTVMPTTHASGITEFSFDCPKTEAEVMEGITSAMEPFVLDLVPLTTTAQTEEREPPAIPEQVETPQQKKEREERIRQKREVDQRAAMKAEADKERQSLIREWDSYRTRLPYTSKEAAREYKLRIISLEERLGLPLSYNRKDLEETTAESQKAESLAEPSPLASARAIDEQMKQLKEELHKLEHAKFSWNGTRIEQIKQELRFLKGERKRRQSLNDKPESKKHFWSRN